MALSFNSLRGSITRSLKIKISNLLKQTGTKTSENNLNKGANATLLHLKDAIAMHKDGEGIEEIRNIISNGDLNATTDDLFKRTPLILAARYGHTKLVKLLLNAGATMDVKRDDNFGDGSCTALMHACRGGHTEIVRLLLEKGANPHTWDIYAEETALITASANGYIEIVKLLISRGADVNTEFKHHIKYTALWAAYENDNFEIVKLLLENSADVNATRNYGGKKTILMYAAKLGNIELVKLLLENGADVLKSTDNKERYTALSLASDAGHSKIVKILKEAEAIKISNITFKH